MFGESCKKFSVLVSGLSVPSSLTGTFAGLVDTAVPQYPAIGCEGDDEFHLPVGVLHPVPLPLGFLPECVVNASGGFAQQLPDVILGHAWLNVLEYVRGQHLAQRLHPPVGPDGNHVVSVAHRLAGVLQRARSVGVFPEHFGCAKLLTHIGFCGESFVQVFHATLVAGDQCEGGGYARQGGGNVRGNQWHDRLQRVAG